MIKCLIIDDEPLARDVLVSYIEEIDYLQLVKSCKDAIEASHVLNEENVDLLFLDINMPKLSGISFYKTLVHKPKVIFTTAYPDHAVEGFELEAVDYLLKPFSFERFLKAINKLQGSQQAPQDSFIMLKADKRNHKIDFDKIVYFESIGDYVKVHLSDEKTLIISETLRKLEQLLPSSFIRVHKSFIISISSIQYVEGNQIQLNKTKVPIGQSYRDAVNKVLRK